MSLAQEKWSAVSIHKVVWAWLRAERRRVAEQLSDLPEDLWTQGLSRLLDDPDLNSPTENRARLRLLYFIKFVYVVEIPPDTQWYEVGRLTDGDLAQLHVVRVNAWMDAADRNELAKVAARKKLALQVPPGQWVSPILWGHDRNGPFTILEGNHRLVAYAASGRFDLDIPVFVGLSPMASVWHFPDQCGFLMQDLLLGRANGIKAEDVALPDTIDS